MITTEEKHQREFLRHVIATVAYRCGKAIKDAPAHFADSKVSETSKTPREILSHMGDLYEWSLSMAVGNASWTDKAPLSWAEESARFFLMLQKFDEFLVSDTPIDCPPERLFQGPIADSLTHVGQIAMLRRVFDSPIRGENYFKAEIQKGRVGSDQSDSRLEFD